MKEKPRITRIEIIQYETELHDLVQEPTIGILFYQPGGVQNWRAKEIRIHTDLGITGEYFGGFEADYTVIAGFANTLIGRNALTREEIYDDLKQATRQQARMGMGVVDIALWNLAGKYHDAPIYELLGGFRKKVPCYASTYVGDHEEGGLNSPEAYADFAEECLDLGYPAFKIHGWQEVDRKTQASGLSHDWRVMAQTCQVCERIGG